MAQALDLTGLDLNNPTDADEVQSRARAHGKALYDEIAAMSQHRPSARPSGSGGQAIPTRTPTGPSAFDQLMALWQEGKAQPKDSDFDPDTTFMDYVKSTFAGGRQLLAAGGGAANWLGGLFKEDDNGELNALQEWGQEFAEHNKGLADKHLKSMSEDAQRLMNYTFTGDGPDTIDLENPGSFRSIMLKLANTAPSLVATIGPVGLAARGGAGLATLARMGHAAKLRAATAAGAVTGAATEGLIGAGFTANDIAEHVDNMSLRELQQIPGYSDLAATGLDEKEIRNAVKADAIRVGATFAAVTSAASGAAGGALQARISRLATTRPRRVGAQAVTEGMQEALQESGEQVGQNLGIREEVDPTQSLTEGVKESAAGGAVLGALMGGGMAIPGKIVNEPSPVEGTDEITPVSNMPPPQGEQPPMAGQPPPHVGPAPEAAPVPEPTPVTPDAPANATPEPATDIAAQIADIDNPDSSKHSAYVSPQNLQTDEQKIALNTYLEELNDQREEPLMVHEDADGGVFITSNRDAYGYYRDGVKTNNPNRSKKARDLGIDKKYDITDPQQRGELLGKLLGYEDSKADAGVTPESQNQWTVSAYNEEGNVVHEEVVTEDNVRKVYEKLEKEYPQVEAAPAPVAQEKRKVRAEEEIKQVVADLEYAADAASTPAATPKDQETIKNDTSTIEATPEVSPEPVAKKPTKKEQAERRAKNVETGVATLKERIGEVETQQDVQALLAAIRKSVANSQKGNREQWQSQLTALETAITRGEVEGFAENFFNQIAGQADSKPVKKGEAKPTKLGLSPRLKRMREDYIEDLGSGSDFRRSTQALSFVMDKRKSRLTNYKDVRKRIEEQHELAEYIKNVEKKLTGPEQARRFITMWVDRTKNPGLNMDGSTKVKLTNEEHKQFAEPLANYIQREISKTGNKGQLSEEQSKAINEKLDKVKIIGRRKYVPTAKLIESQEVFEEINEILAAAQKTEGKKDAPSEQVQEKLQDKAEQRTSEAPKQEEKPAPKRRAKPAEAPAKPGPEVTVKKKRKPPAKPKADPNNPKMIDKGRQTGKVAAQYQADTKKGLEVTFADNDEFGKKGYIWRPSGAQEFYLSIQHGLEMERFRTGFTHRGELVKALQEKGIAPIVENHYAQIKEQADAEIAEQGTAIPEDYSVDQLTEHPLWKALDANTARPARGFQRLVQQAINTSDAKEFEEILGEIGGIGADLEVDMDAWGELIRVSHAQFQQRLAEETNADLIAAQEPEHIDMEAHGFEEGLTFGVNNDIVQDTKKEDEYQKLLARLTQDYGELGAQQMLDDVDKNVTRKRAQLEEGAKADITSTDEATRKTAKNKINEEIKKFKKEEYGRLSALLDDIPDTDVMLSEDEQQAVDDYFEQQQLEQSDESLIDDSGRGAGFDHDWSTHGMDFFDANGYREHPAVDVLSFLRKSLSAKDALAMLKLPQHTTETWAKIIGEDVETLNPVIRGMFERLQDAGLDVPIVFNEDLDRIGAQGLAHHPVFDGGKLDGKPDPRLAVIELAPSLLKPRNRAELVHTLMHEWIHVATVSGLNNNPQLKKELDSLRKRAKNKSKYKDEYGYTDVYEFVAEAFTDVIFQHDLQSIPLKSIYKKDELPSVLRRMRTAWDLFVGAIAKYMGIGSNAQATALNHALALSNEAFLNRSEIDKLYGRKVSAHGKMETHAHLVPRNSAERSEMRVKAREYGSRGGLSFHSMDQLFRRYASKFRRIGTDAFDRYMARWREKQGIVSNERRKGDKVTQKWAELERKDGAMARDMAELMVDSTMAGIDPRNAPSSTYNVHKMRQAQDLVHRYNALSPQAKEVFNSVAQYHKTQRREVEEFGIEALLFRSGQFTHKPSLTNLAQRLARLKKGDRAQIESAIILASRNQIGPAYAAELADAVMNLKNLTSVEGIYFPLQREGEYVVKGRRSQRVIAPDPATAQDWVNAIHANASAGGKTFLPNSNAEIDPNNKSVITVHEEVYELHTTLQEAKDAATRIESALPGGTVSAPLTKRDVSQPQVTGAMAKFASQIKRNVNRAGGGGAFDQQIDAALIQLLAEEATRNSELRRRNVQGANSTDLRQFFAKRVMANAWSIADLKTSVYMEDAVMDMELAVDNHTNDETQRELQRVLNHLHQRETQNLGLRKEHPITDKLSRLGYIMALASPAYSVINATQTALVTFPVMAAKYGTGRASRALMANLRQSIGREAFEEMKATKGGLMALPTNYADEMAARWGLSNTQLTTGDRLNVDDVKTKGDMLKALIDVNVIDSSFIQSLYEAINAQKNDALGRTWEVLSTWSKSWPQMIEQINRITTAGAVYDLAVQDGKSPVEATQQAIDTITKTHGDYSDANKPKAMKFAGEWSKVILMFKTYMQFITALYVENIMAAVAGKGDLSRKEASKVLGGLTLMHTAAAGVLGGLPTQPIAAAMAVLGALGLDDPDEPLTLEDHIEEFALYIANGNEDIAEMITRGLPRGIGIDLHNRVGLHGMFMLPAGDYLDETETAKHYLLQMLGPMATYLVNAMAGAQYLVDGDIQKGVQTAAPKLVKDFIKAYTHAQEGVTDKSGVPLLPSSQYGDMNSAMQAFGFTPQPTARRYEKFGAVARYEGRLAKRSTKLKQNWYNAKTAEEKNEALRAIQEFNRKNPGKYVIKSSSLIRGMQSRKETELKRTTGRLWRDPYTSTQVGWATK